MRRFEGGCKAVPRSFPRASEGLEGLKGELKGASKELDKGFKAVSRELEKGLKMI